MPVHAWRVSRPDSWRTRVCRLLLAAAFAAPALADDWQTCAKGAGDDAIAACTRAIKSGTYNGRTLALPIPTAASNGRPRAISPRRSPITTRRSRPTRSRPPSTISAASLYAAAAEYDKAIADYDKAIELNPTYASALNNRGLAYFNDGQNQRAIADYDAAIKIEPDAVRLNNRGNAYASRAQYDRAIQDFDAAVISTPNMRSRSTIAATPISPRARPIAPSLTTIRRWRSIRNTRTPWSTAASPTRRKATLDRAIADYDEALRL